MKNTTDNTKGEKMIHDEIIARWHKVAETTRIAASDIFWSYVKADRVDARRWLAVDITHEADGLAVEAAWRFEDMTWYDN